MITTYSIDCSTLPSDFYPRLVEILKANKQDFSHSLSRPPNINWLVGASIRYSRVLHGWGIFGISPEGLTTVSFDRFCELFGCSYVNFQTLEESIRC